MSATGQTHRATRWNALGRGADAAIRYGVVVVLVQQGWMSALEWGVLEGALIVTGFLDLFVDLGTGQAVIQRKTLTRAFTATIFWFNLLVGLLLGGLLLLGAPTLAGLLGVPESAGVMRLLAPSFLVASLGLVQRCLLARELEFRGISTVNAVSAVAYGALALTLAARGMGASALALATLTAGVVKTVGYWFLGSWRPSLSFERASLTEIYRFSSRLMAANLTGYLLQRVDRILAARFLGPEALGLLAVARRIVVQPARTLPNAVVGTLIPSLAQVKDDLSRLRERYERAVAGLAFLLAPVLVGLAATADLWMRSGQQALQEGAGTLIWCLFPYAACQVVLALSGPVFVATGRTDLMLRTGLLLGLWLLAVESLALWIWGGTVALALALSVGTLTGLPFALAVPARLAGSSLSSVLEGPLRSLACASVMGGAVLALRPVVTGLGFPGLVELGLLAGAGVLLHTLLVLVVRPSGTTDFLTLVGSRRLAARLERGA